MCKIFELECGDCPTCWDRRLGYLDAGITDPTKYTYPFSKEHPTYYSHLKEEKYEKGNRD